MRDRSLAQSGKLQEVNTRVAAACCRVRGNGVGSALPVVQPAAASGGSAMAYQQQVTEHYWGWCRWWGIPYPCRKTRTVTKWCYDFSYLTVDYHYVYTNYVGCELNQLYSWRQWEFSLSGGAFTLYFVTRCFDDQKTSSGPCSPEVIGRLRQMMLGSEQREPVQTSHEAPAAE
jgi:hypothetical protein